MSARDAAAIHANENLPNFEVQRALVLGARDFSEGNSNDTWEAELQLQDNSLTYAIIKDIPPREIANEILGSALAVACGLPVPRVFLAKAHTDIVPAQNSHKLPNGYHLLFASERQSAPPLGRRWTGRTLPQEIVDALATWKHCGTLIAFDTWVANIDRHEYNLLFEDMNDIWLIDHGLCFNGSFWQPGQIIHDHPYANRVAEWLCPRFTQDQLQGLRASVIELCDATRRLDLEAIGLASHALPLFPPTIGEAIFAFLTHRIPVTPCITGKLTGINGLLT